METTLKLIRDSPNYVFESIGIYDRHGDILPSPDFPIGNRYTLVAGNFPLDYTGHYSESGLYHTLHDNISHEEIRVKLIGSQDTCEKHYIDDHGITEHKLCHIDVEKVIAPEPKRSKRGGRILKNKSNRRKSNRRKSNRRKSNRRKSNRRR